MSIFNIPFHYSALKTIAYHQHKSCINDIQLTDNIILMPNKRIITSLESTFGDFSLTCPKIIATSDTYPLVLMLGAPYIEELLQNFPQLKSTALSIIERGLFISRLLSAKDSNLSLSTSFYLSYHIGLLLDYLHKEQVDFKNIQQQIPTNLATQWENNIEFFQYIYNEWENLIPKEYIDSEVYKDLSVQALTWLIKHKLPNINISIAGITQTTPAIIDLLKTVNSLSNGNIYIIGLDKNLLDKNVGHQHPQYKLLQLVEKLDNPIIENLEYQQFATASLSRMQLASHIFSSNITNNELLKLDSSAYEGLSILTTTTKDEEASIIALKMREAYEQNLSAALVTNDIKLSRRVSSELKKWNIILDDSFGSKLIKTMRGNYFSLIAQALCNNWDIYSLLGVLKHNLTTFGNKEKVHKACYAIDLYVGRKLLINNDLEEIIANTASTIEANDNPDLKDAYSILIQLQKITSKFQALASAETLNFQDLLNEQIHIMNLLVEDKLFTHDDGVHLFQLLKDLIKSSLYIKINNIHEYPSFINEVMSITLIHPKPKQNYNLFIHGIYQAQLMQHDLVIIGDMNEGSMPVNPSAPVFLHDKLLNMCELDSSQVDISINAYIFSQLFCASNVLLTQSTMKDASVINLRSRWLSSLMNILKVTKVLLPLLTKDKYLLEWHNSKQVQYVTQSNSSNNILHIPKQLIPNKIWATQLETLLFNPYIYYIQYILKSPILEPINPPYDKKIFGIIIHATIEDYLNKQRSEVPSIEVVQKEMLSILKSKYNPLLKLGEVAFIDYPKAKHIVKSLVSKIHYIVSQTNSNNLITEFCASMKLKNNLTLASRIDLIFKDNANNVHIIDFKTSKKYTKEELRTYKVQLLLGLHIIQNSDNQFNQYNTLVPEYYFLPKAYNKSLELLNPLDKIEEYNSILEDIICNIENSFYNTYNFYNNNQYYESQKAAFKQISRLIY